MLNLHYSNHLEALLEPLSRGLSRNDPFFAPQIAVPNRNLEEWLRLRLAEQSGIAVHLRFEKLDSLLRRILAPEGARPLDDQLERLLLMELLDALGQSPAFEAVHSYLNAEGDREMRLFQLADRMLWLFRDYAFQRTAMVEAWEQGKRVLDHPHEGWQAKLWCELYGAKGRLARLNRNLKNPFVPFHQVPLPKAGQVCRFETLHLFGISYISRFHQRLLERLARHGEIHLYVLNPCCEYWADVRGRQAVPEFGEWDLDLFNEENPFLQSWGRPGREYFKLMNELGDWNYQDHFVEPIPSGEPDWSLLELARDADPRQLPEASLLQWLQAHILHRRPLPARPLLREADQSLAVIGCAGPKREAEAVASRIWALLEADPSLAFRDIAVIVTRMDAYQLELENAFSRAHNLPYNLVDGCFGGVAHLAEAFLWLLELPQGHAERATLFQLFQHPNFRARFPEANVPLWLDFCDRLGVFSGRDRQEQGQMGMAYLERALYHWDQALVRMALGDYFHPDDRGQFLLGGENYAIEPFSENDAEEARAFSVLLRSLLADTDLMARSSLSAASWSRFLRSMVETYLAPLGHEKRGFQRILELCGKLRDLGEAFDDPDTPLPFARIRPFLRAELKQLSPHFGYYLMEGVTISSFLPMRPIPFKVVFVMGLNGTLFPAQTRRDTLDLRNARPLSAAKSSPGSSQEGPGLRFESLTREPGDVSETERDRYMFLETLVSTREKLVLSYSNRDPRTMDPLPASSIVEELLGWARALAPTLEKSEEPFKAYSEAYDFPFLAAMQAPEPKAAKPKNYDPEANWLAAARRNYFAAFTWAKPEAPLSLAKRACRKIDVAQFPPSLQRAFALLAPSGPKLEAKPILDVQLRDLRRFLECPLQASAERLLRLREPEPEKAEKSIEPFGITNRVRKQILSKILESSLCAWQGELRDFPRERLLRKLAIALRQAADQAKVPAGPLEAPFFENANLLLEHWLKTLKEAGVEGPFERLSLGTNKYRFGSKLLDPLTFAPGEVLPDRAVRLIGETDLLGKVDHEITSIHLSTKKKITPVSRDSLRGFLDSWVIAAMGQAQSCKALVLPAEGKYRLTDFQQGQAAQARATLAVLLRELLQPRHDSLLPFEVINAARKQKGDFAQNLAAQLRNQLEAPDNLGSAFGQVRNWQEFPLIQDPEQHVRDRFGVFFEQLDGPNPAEESE